jgi:hypothetical protein
MQPIPGSLLARPFHRAEALALGVSARVLEGRRFVRVHPRVYRHRDHVMSFDDAVAAARLALPEDAHPTGITRLQMLGLDFGPQLPLRFVVQGDLHLALDDIFLHRTIAFPPLDEIGVHPAAAYVAYCRRARTIDAIAVGDWLVHRGHVDGDQLRALVGAQEWRDGAAETGWVLDHLVGEARSLRESEVRSILAFAGLPRPEPNGPIELGGAVVHGDLWFEAHRTAVEYEGSQHQVDRGQYVSDIDRYALYRRHGVRYVQVTRELARQPRSLVRRVHAELVAGGYEGPAPDFGATWDHLFSRLAHVVPRAGRGSRRLRSVS